MIELETVAKLHGNMDTKSMKECKIIIISTLWTKLF